MLQAASPAWQAVRDKMAVGILLRKIACVLPAAQPRPNDGLEQNIPRELMLIAALRGGGDPNETIYQSRLHRHGACGLGDGRIRDAARSRKRDCRGRQRRRRAGEGRTWPWPRSYGPRRPRSSLWMGPRTRSSLRSSSSLSLIPLPESTFGDLRRNRNCCGTLQFRGSCAAGRFVPTRVSGCLGS